MRTLISVIDDDKHMLKYVGKVLSNEGTDVQLFETPAEFIASLSHSRPDVIVCDLLMPGMDGINVLRYVRSFLTNTPFILLTTESKVTTAVSAMKEGVVDYITKPIDANEFKLRIQRAIEVGRLREHFSEELEKTREQYTIEAITGSSTYVKKARELVLFTLASTHHPVWLRGEEGSGKSFISRIIHYSGATARYGSHTYDCSNRDIKAVESDLFGKVFSVAGSRTVRQRGLFEQADGGSLTLFNPEELDNNIQKKLAEFFTTGEFIPVDGTESVRAQLRVIFVTTTQKPHAGDSPSGLHSALAKVLSPATLDTVPLSERLEDVPHLVSHLLDRMSSRDGVEYAVTEDAMKKLTSYKWSGNVKELINTVERSSLMCKDGVIQPADVTLGSHTWGPGGGQSYFSIPQGLTIKEVQGEYVRQSLDYFNNNLEKTAAALGISRKTLWEIRRKYHLP